MSCSVDHRRSLDPKLLWLWGKLAAVVPIQPLAWKLPYAAGAVLKKPKKKKNPDLVNGNLIDIESTGYWAEVRGV